MKNKNTLLLSILLSAVFLFSYTNVLNAQDKQPDDPDTAAVADTGIDETQPVFSEQDDMKPLIAKQAPYSISYGGWLTEVLMNDSNSETMASTTIGKAWFKSTLPYNSEFYFRITDVFTYFIDTPIDIDPVNEFDIDIASLSISLYNNTIKFYLGRKYYTLGTGLVFSNRGDGAELEYFSKYADIKIFGTYTGLLNEDTNTSRLFTGAGFDEGKRIFIGGSLSKSIRNQTMYLLGLYQMDNNDEPAGIKTRYDSQHVGAGLKGVYKNAFYFTELVLEMGTGYTELSNNVAQEEQDVFAAAALIGLNYYFDASVKPALLFNYAFGSGDGDRQSAISATGNRSGNDSGFMYFGNYTGGYALKPYLSNMHVIRLGFSLSPLNNSDKKYLKRINVILNYSSYLKQNTDGVINGGEATADGRLVGHGIDAALRYAVFSDFSAFGNVGLFIPGSAYEEGNNDTRSFVMAGFNLSF